MDSSQKKIQFRNINEVNAQFHAKKYHFIFSKCNILIKITQCQDLVTIFLQNRTTDFDETLHVAWAWSGEGFSTSGRSGYSPVQKKGGRRPP